MTLPVRRHQGALPNKPLQRMKASVASLPLAFTAERR
jgi:hypothetical protein